MGAAAAAGSSARQNCFLHTLCEKKTLDLLQKKVNVADAERLLLYVLQSQPRVKKVKNKFKGATICIKIKFPHNLFQQKGSNIKNEVETHNLIHL
jgi:hypothetical protein